MRVAFLDFLLGSVNDNTVFLRDVANVRDGDAVTSNLVRLDGRNAAMVSMLKLGHFVFGSLKRRLWRWRKMFDMQDRDFEPKTIGKKGRCTYPPG